MKKFFVIVGALTAFIIATPLAEAQSLGEKEARRAEEALRTEKQAVEELIRIIYGVNYPSPKFSVAYGLNGSDTVQINPLGSPPAKEDMDEENLKWLHDHMKGYHETVTPQAVREFARRLLFAEAVFRHYSRYTKEDTAKRFNVSSEFIVDLWNTYQAFYREGNTALPAIPSGARVEIKLP